MYFEIVTKIDEIETIAIGKSIRTILDIEKRYGKGRWRKMKGKAKIQLKNGSVKSAELHWYEANGIGRKNFKIKRFLG